MIATFTGREPHPIFPVLDPEIEHKLALVGKADTAEKYYHQRAKLMMLAAHDPLRYGYEPPIWKVADDQVAQLKILFPSGVTHLLNMGGNRACLVEGSLIEGTPIEAITCQHYVRAWDGEAWSYAKADASFSKGVLPCVRVKLSNGQEFACSRDHRVLTSHGWRRACDLTSGVRLLEYSSSLQRSSGDISQPTSRQDALHSTSKVAGFQSGYPSNHHSNGEPLRPEAETDQDGFPSPADVPRYSTACENTFHSPFLPGPCLPPDRPGVQDDIFRRIRDDLFSHLLSTPGGRGLILDLCAGIETQPCDILYRPTLPSPSDQVIFEAVRRLTAEFSRQQSIFQSAAQGIRYDCELPYDTITTKVVSVKDAGQQECFDFHVPGYENYMHAGVCHHNSKTNRAAKRVIQCLINNPGCRIWCLQSTEVASRADQQSLIFKYLPPEWRPETGRMKPKYDRTTKIVYSDAGGFTNNILVLPNGSKCEFKFYGADVRTLESAQLIMVWADELIQPDWIEALRFRLVNENGHMLITFTPVEGYSSTVKMYLQDAVTIEEVDAPLLPQYDTNGKILFYQKVPRVQQSGIPSARIVYFHTSDNPFGNYAGMEVEVRGSNEERVKTRVYGVPTKSSSSQFNFNTSVHVITPNEFAEWVKKYPNGTRYHLVDPCSGRNWFMAWAFCPKPGMTIWYREWPSHGHTGAYIEGIGDPGAWASLVSTRARREGTKSPEDGEKGPAQEPFKFSLRRYQQEIVKAETGETIFERLMDARYGNSPKEEEESVTTLIQQMNKLGMFFTSMTSEKKILGVNDGSVDMLNSCLYYDKSKNIGEYSEELSRINEPQMYFLSTCPNMIFSFETWTGKDGQNGACKDAVDVARGLVLSQRGYVGPDSMRVRQRGGCY